MEGSVVGLDSADGLGDSQPLLGGPMPMPESYLTDRCASTFRATLRASDGERSGAPLAVKHPP